MNTEKKKEFLEEELKNLGKVAVAFSSGVDSTYLLKTAHDVLGKNAVAITARAKCFPERETREAEEFCRKEGIKQIVFDFEPLSLEEFRSNVKNRCYFCKKALFSRIKDIAEENGIDNIIEGSNLDDLSDYRPGMQAIKELCVLSPLLDAKLKKSEIRLLSKEAGLKTFDKPSYACLASRFVYGEEINEEKLKMIERAENKLFSLGFSQFRVRLHGRLARIEVDKEDFSKIVEFSDEITPYLKELGFSYVSLDLSGYKTGSMNP